MNMREIFADLEPVQYCLLRNYEFLLDEKMKPESLDASVAQNDIGLFAEILKKKGFNERKRQFSKKHRAFFRVENGKKLSFDVQVGGVYWNDLRYMDESIFERRVKKGFFYTLSDEDTCVMLIAHSILGKRRFKEKYQWIINELLRKVDDSLIEENIANIFSPSIARNVLKNVRNDSFDSIRIYPIVAYFLLKNSLKLFGFAALFLRWIKWKRFIGVAPLISIVGPDGAGKTSLVEHLKDYLMTSGRNVLVIYTGRGRGHVLPISRAGYLYKKREQKSNKRMKFLYVLALPVFAFDLLLRYTFLIFPNRLRKKIVITDRYASDILLMKNVPLWSKNFFALFFPKPTISILLYNDAAVLHERRKEESIEELQRQLDILDKRNYTMRVKTVDKRKDTQKVVDLVMTELLKNWW